MLLLLVSTAVSGQEHLKVYVNKEKDHHITMSGTLQFWLRYTNMNPGSLVNNAPRDNLLDVSLRRYRLNFQGKASDRLRYRLSFGDNNINYYTYRSFNVKILEAFVDYQVNQYLGIGIGKQGWSGLSRNAAPSATQTLGFDIDFVSIPLVVVYDDILRRFGIYARGIIHKFDYRVALSRPSYFPATQLSPLPEQATFADKQPLYQFSSYLKYQFREHESQLTPWAAGTHAGKKNVLSIGAGMLHQPNTTWLLAGPDTVYNPITSFAADLFYEQPFPDNRAISLYFAYHHHNLGRNFIRNIGINNPASGGIPTDYINGPGNRTPVVGTGNILFFQTGYLLPVDKQNKMQIQPNASLALGMLQALNDPMVLYNIGVNYYLNGQWSKISAGYENRPLFKHEGNRNVKTDRKGLGVVQYQVVF